MKFTKKTAVALAIAGIAAAPMMASASTTLSGVVEVKIAGSDSETAIANTNGDSSFEEGEARIQAGDVNVAISASQALNSGLTGYGSVRLDLDGLSGSDYSDNDSVYVGVKGGFGDLRFGEVPNPGEYGQVANDIYDMGESINEGISYTGSFGGATVGLAYSPAPNQDILGVGAKFTYKGFAIGLGMQDLDETQNISAGVSFAFAGASIALHGAQLGDGYTAADGDISDETIGAVQVGYGIAGVALSLTYHTMIEAETNHIRLDASYALGGGLTASTRFNTVDNGDDDTSNDWRVMMSKSF